MNKSNILLYGTITLRPWIGYIPKNKDYEKILKKIEKELVWKIEKNN